MAPRGQAPNGVDLSRSVVANATAADSLGREPKELGYRRFAANRLLFPIFLGLTPKAIRWRHYVAGNTQFPKGGGCCWDCRISWPASTASSGSHSRPYH